MVDFKNMKDVKINSEILNKVQFVNPINNVMSKIKKQEEASLRALQESRLSKEQEELRKHNELVAAINKAADNGATIVIGDNANGIQIQQNSDNAKQEMSNSQTFNYDKAFDVLHEIKAYFEYPQFAITYGDKTDLVKQIVNETIEAVSRKDEPSLIKKSLRILKDITFGVTEGLIATGILGLLSLITL